MWNWGSSTCIVLQFTGFNPKSFLFFKPFPHHPTNDLRIGERAMLFSNRVCQFNKDWSLDGSLICRALEHRKQTLGFASERMEGGALPIPWIPWTLPGSAVSQTTYSRNHTLTGFQKEKHPNHAKQMATSYKTYGAVHQPMQRTLGCWCPSPGQLTSKAINTRHRRQGNQEQLNGSPTSGELSCLPLVNTVIHVSVFALQQHLQVLSS